MLELSTRIGMRKGLLDTSWTAVGLRPKIGVL